jgi:LmbE family N-acetylglucosaminyl deacetylase
LTLTKGGAGKIHIHGNGRSLKEIRENELIKATKILRVSKLILRDFPDGKLRFTISSWEKVVDKEICKHNPSVVVTYGASGTTGHPDHIILSKIVFRLAKKYRFKLLWESIVPEVANHFLSENLIYRLPKPTHRLNIRPFLWRHTQAIKAHRSQRGFSLSYRLLLVFLWYFRWESYTLADLTKKPEFKFIKFKL